MQTIQRQFINDATGTPIGVILPIEEFVLVQGILENRTKMLLLDDQNKLRMMEKAAVDPYYLADLTDTMEAFAHIDGEWWEHSE